MSNDLFSQHQHLARRIAYGMAGKLPRSVAREDLEQAALIGLHQWCSAHPDNSHPGWRSGLLLRMRGAVIDWLRAEDYLPRRARAKGHYQILHLEDLSGEDGPRWEDTLGQFDDPSDFAHLDVLEALGANLPQRERHLVVEVFGREAQQSDLARDFGLSGCRISQLLTRATKTMRDHLARPRQVAAQVPATPKHRVRDFKRELWLARRNALWEQLEPGMNSRGLAQKLGLAETTVYNWCTSTRMSWVPLTEHHDPIHEAVRERGKALITAALRAEGGNGRRAGLLLKLAHSSVGVWRNRLIPDAPRGCPSGPPVKVDRAILAALRSRGLRDSEIAREVGMHESSVGAALKKAGVPPLGLRRRLDITSAGVAALRAEGLSRREIALRLRCSDTTVKYHLRRAGAMRVVSS